MAPILIDNRGLIKLGLISLLTVLVVFCAGYFSGYQKASMFYTATSEIESLVLPERNPVEDTNIDPRSPETIIAGEEIDVDQPAVTPVADVQVQGNKDDAVIEAAKNSSPQPESVEIDSSSEPSVEVVNKESSQGVQTSGVSKDDISKDIKKVDVSSLTSDELDEIKYSVQVGVFGSLINAENMVEKLQAQQFDAYVADYRNKKNEIRYNVRFGYFTHKQAAITSLKRYKNVGKGDGYLVNFSIDSIVNLADKNPVNDNAKPASPIDVIDESQPSETHPSEITHNKISKEDYLSKLQPEALIKN